MNNETKNEYDSNAVMEIDETELEPIAASLRVRSGLQAGFQIQRSVVTSST